MLDTVDCDTAITNDNAVIFFGHERVNGPVESRPATVNLQHVGGILE